MLEHEAEIEQSHLDREFQADQADKAQAAKASEQKPSTQASE
jgi:hypothetical protein